MGSDLAVATSSSLSNSWTYEVAPYLILLVDAFLLLDAMRFPSRPVTFWVTPDCNDASLVWLGG